MFFASNVIQQQCVSLAMFQLVSKIINKSSYASQSYEENTSLWFLKCKYEEDTSLYLLKCRDEEDTSLWLLKCRDEEDTSVWLLKSRNIDLKRHKLGLPDKPEVAQTTFPIFTDSLVHTGSLLYYHFSFPEILWVVPVQCYVMRLGTRGYHSRDICPNKRKLGLPHKPEMDATEMTPCKNVSTLFLPKCY